MIIDSYQLIPKTLDFKFAAGTSRGVLRQHNVLYLVIHVDGVVGIGEIAPLPKLSVDYDADFESVIAEIIWGEIDFSTQENILKTIQYLNLEKYPSLIFALETAFLDILNKGKKVIFDTDFVKGDQRIPINGLVWMNTKEHMLDQVQSKIEQGFQCVKIKIGAINLEDELEVLHYIREHYSNKRLILRVDANGAFNYEEAKVVLKSLEELNVHSIEQPIKPQCLCEMRSLAQYNNVGVALDEELIGICGIENKRKLLEEILPNYLILKPTLLGGLHSCLEWIELAQEFDIDWWLTSALESNIGLNAVTQFASYLDVDNFQGLGTGQLYHNNIESPLTIEKGDIYYNSSIPWGTIFNEA